MTRSLLVVDDDASVREALRRVFRNHDWNIAMASDAASCLAAYERERPDVVLLDHGLPGLSGLQLLGVLRDRDPDATVIMLTGRAEVPIAVEAMRLGAENFLTKPVEPAHLDAAVTRACEYAEIKKQNRYYRARVDRQGSDDIALLALPVETRDQLALLAEGTAPVLLTGETGTGKGWVAQLLHTQSSRARGPSVDVNCAGLTATFLDSELFGHEKGAFTDAKVQKQGLFEVAHGGTLFLDEIGDLGHQLQPKLLKVIESQRFRRLGGTREISVDVRLVAATNVDLQAAVRSGQFREDLYYRLAVFPLHLPPLRERGREIVHALAQHLLADLCHRMHRGSATFASEALALLLRHNWPGNIRELRNTIERALLLGRDDDVVRASHLPPEFRAGGAPAVDVEAAERAFAPDDDWSLAAVERRHIARVLQRVDGNRVHAARMLGISRATLYKKLAQD